MSVNDQKVYVLEGSEDGVTHYLCVAGQRHWLGTADTGVIVEMIATLERYRAGLNEIASWREGPEVNSRFDEPGSAQKARDALEEP